MTGRQYIHEAQKIKEDLIRAEVDSLVSAIQTGVIVMPSDMVLKTTILVPPNVWRKLEDRIAENRKKEDER